MDCSTPGFPVLYHLPELAQTHVHRSVTPSNHLMLGRPLLLLSSIFPSIRVFSNKLTLHIRGPKHWSFSFSINPSNEYSGCIFNSVRGCQIPPNFHCFQKYGWKELSLTETQNRIEGKCQKLNFVSGQEDLRFKGEVHTGHTHWGLSTKRW